MLLPPGNVTAKQNSIYFEFQIFLLNILDSVNPNSTISEILFPISKWVNSSLRQLINTNRVSVSECILVSFY